MPFDPITNTLFFIFIVLAMACVGLAASGKDILNAVAERSFISKSLLANFIISPIVAFVVVRIFNLPDAVSATILVLSFAAGGLNAVQFSSKSQGYLATAAGLLFVLSLVSLVITPLAAGFIYGESGDLAYGPIVVRVALLLLLPMVVGWLIRDRSADLAEKLYKPFMLTSTIAFIASVISGSSLRQESLSLVGMPAVAAMVIFILIMMAVGWALGGPERGRRQVLAVVTNLRNVGIVYVIATQCCSDPIYVDTIFAFMVLMVGQLPAVLRI